MFCFSVRPSLTSFAIMPRGHHLFNLESRYLLLPLYLLINQMPKILHTCYIMLSLYCLFAHWFDYFSSYVLFIGVNIFHFCNLFISWKMFQALDRLGHVDAIINDPEYELLFFYLLLHQKFRMCLSMFQCLTMFLWWSVATSLSSPLQMIDQAHQ
jgi:hypothetical protein